MKSLSSSGWRNENFRRVLIRTAPEGNSLPLQHLVDVVLLVHEPGPGCKKGTQTLRSLPL